MRRLIIIALIIIAFSTQTKAQDYNTGIGLRAGFFSGVTVKHFLSQRNAIEGILGTRWQGFVITGLYEVHHPAFHAVNLKWYYGAGAHLGFWNGDDVGWGDDDKNYAVIGLDGILGLEYKFPGAPINVGIDWKPVFNVIGHPSVWADGGAISVRYVF